MNKIADKLNEIGFSHLGEIKEVTDFEVITKEEETTEMTNQLNPIPVAKSMNFAQIELNGEETIEMKMKTVRSMIRRYEG